MRRFLFIFAVFLSGLFLVAGCGKHHGPEDVPSAPKYPVSIRISFDSSISDTTVTRAVTSQSRYIVRAFEAENDGSLSSSPALDTTFLLQIFSETFLSVSLEEGEYDIAVWCDRSDTTYNTSDFSKVAMSPRWTPPEEKESYYGSTKLYVSELGTSSCSVNLFKSGGTYTIVAKGIDKNVDYEGGYVKVNYLGRQPYLYNILKGITVGTQEDDGYTYSIERTDDTRAVLAYDWIMADYTNLVITVSLSIYNKDGGLIRNVRSVSFPVRQGKNTVVKDRLLCCG